MNSTRFFAQLSRGLKIASDELEDALPDLNNALLSALQAYSRYRPALRRVGTGTLLEAVTTGASSLFVMGGPFTPGQSLTLDSLGFGPETVIVQSLKRVERGEEEEAYTCLQLTLAAALNTDHDAGAFLTPAQPGLLLKMGRDTYALPTDWIGVDEESFSLATGQRQSQTRQSGYYDGAYRQSAQLSGLGYGQRSGFGAGYGVNVAPIAGIFGVAVSNGETLYRFVDDAPARLIVSPAPSADRLLDFYYNGCHTVETVPQSDSEAVLCYARYTALLAQAKSLAEQGDSTAGPIKESTSSSARNLSTLAEAALAQFEQLLVNRPYTSGG